jgi:hypothetical protein
MLLKRTKSQLMGYIGGKKGKKMQPKIGRWSPYDKNGEAKKIKNAARTRD